MKKILKKTSVPEEDIQLGMGLNEPRINRFLALKQRFSLRLKRFETKTFVRSFANWFYLIISLSLLFLQFRYIYLAYDSLPSQIPLLQYLIDLDEKLVPKQFIFITPSLSLLIILFSILPSYKWYNSKKDLAQFTLLFMLFAVAGLTYALAKIISQYYG